VVDGIPVMVSLEAGSSEVSVELNAGETIQINICATTDILGTYPMSTIKTTVSFA
jgi:hypothetical protein